VNDRPHIGHLYTTTIADIVARYHRLIGDEVFFLTGTDEHAAKVVDAAADRGLSPLQWADQNAAAFQDTFSRLGVTNDDFIRTSQERHKTKVVEYIRRLMDSGDVYLGEYQGWYDVGQEEYVPQNKAKEYDYKSPINGKPLVQKSEKNYFFALSKYQDRLLELIGQDQGEFVRPTARRNEVLARVREGLHDVPISRTGARGWGIAVPGESDQTVYVWIDALFNYRTAIDASARKGVWPASVHLIAKDILWFHAVIWPALLMALDWPLPKQIYAHSFWISEGQKMSKSLGNFIDLEKIDHYVDTFGLDAMRYFLATAGPMGTTDSDFADAKFIEVYNSDLANTLGNCFSRVVKMTNRYFDGIVQAKTDCPTVPIANFASHVKEYEQAMKSLDLHKACSKGINLIWAIDRYIENTQPFKLAKDPSNLPRVGEILYNCTEALRIASLLLWPVIPGKIEQLWQQIGCQRYVEALRDRGQGQFANWTAWGGLEPGVTVSVHEPLFPRYNPD